MHVRKSVDESVDVVEYLRVFSYGGFFCARGDLLRQLPYPRTRDTLLEIEPIMVQRVA